LVRKIYLYFSCRQSLGDVGLINVINPENVIDSHQIGSGMYQIYLTMAWVEI